MKYSLEIVEVYKLLLFLLVPSLFAMAFIILGIAVKISALLLGITVIGSIINGFLGFWLPKFTRNIYLTEIGIVINDDNKKNNLVISWKDIYRYRWETGSVFLNFIILYGRNHKISFPVFSNEKNKENWFGCMDNIVFQIEENSILRPSFIQKNKVLVISIIILLSTTFVLFLIYFDYLNNVKIVLLSLFFISVITGLIINISR